MGTSRLEVEIVGEGRNLVLLHSLLTDRSSYGPLAARLAGQRRLILVNLPGFGRSQAFGSTIGDYAARVATLFDDLALSPATDVMGNGLGSFVSLAVAGTHGSKFDRLVLIGAGSAFPEAGRATFRGLAAKVDAEGLGAIAEVAMRRMFPDDFIASNPATIADRKAVFERIDPKVFATACRALASLDLGAVVPSIHNRTLIVVGEQDGATPPALANGLASRMPDATVLELPGVGHCPHVQNPDLFVSAIAPFLELELTASAASAVGQT